MPLQSIFELVFLFCATVHAVEENSELRSDYTPENEMDMNNEKRFQLVLNSMNQVSEYG